MEVRKTVTRRTLEQRAAEYQPARSMMLSHPAIDEVRTNVGMPMEFDPRQGEVPKPDGIEFTLPNDEDLSILRLIDEVCEKHDLKVRLPDFKQPDFTYTSHKGETRAPNKNADYDAFVRLVDDD